MRYYVTIPNERELKQWERQCKNCAYSDISLQVLEQKRYLMGGARMAWLTGDGKHILVKGSDNDNCMCSISGLGVRPKQQACPRYEQDKVLWVQQEAAISPAP